MTGSFLASLHRFVGGEHDLAGSGARRCRKTLGDHFDLGLGVDDGMEQLVEGGRLHAEHRLFLRDQAFLHHVHGDLDRGVGGALAGAGLEHEQRAFLHRELEVLHVAVMFLQLRGDVPELLVHLGHLFFEIDDRMGRPDAGHHVLALGVRQVLAVELLGARRGVPGEADARCRGVAHVAEHHGLDVHGRAEVARDVVQPAVGDGAGIVPGAEHRVAGHGELLPDVLRETRAS